MPSYKFTIGVIVVRLLCIVFTLLLTSCTEHEVGEAEIAPLVVQLTQVKLADSERAYQFPATVSAVKNVDVKFEISGRLVFTDLVAGSMVKKGQVLAKIDAAPFQRKVAESKIRNQVAARDLKRLKKVFSKNVASQSDVDDAESAYSIAEIALANAEQDLSYTTIRAPFDAVIGERYIENNSYINAGDTLANLQDRSQLYFTFDVSERIMTANAHNKKVSATAYILGQEENIFAIHYVEHETTPDPISQTYKVTFALDGKISNAFYPGSRAMVNVNVNKQVAKALLIPLNAISGDENTGFTVWRFNPKTSEVEKVTIKITKLTADYVVVKEGLTTKDKIVSAAVSQMRVGLKVKEYKAGF